MKKYKTALIFGGRGLEHEVSVEGAKYAIAKIDPDIFELLPIFIDKNGEWLILKNRNRSIEELIKADSEKVRVFPQGKAKGGGITTEEGDFITVCCAFTLLHGDFGEDGTVGGALATANIPYIGTENAESAFCCDKIYTKLCAEHLGIATAKWTEATRLSSKEAKSRAEELLNYPMFIKPARLGSSFGAHAVYSESEFEKAYENAAKLGNGRILIEELVDISAELECGLFSTKSKELFTKIGEIRYSGDFYDYGTKYEDQGSCSVTADSPLEETLGDGIREYSRKLASLIGISGISRFDFFLTEDGRILFNEINTLPGFTHSSLYPRLLENSGLSVKTALTELLLDKISEN